MNKKIFYTITTVLIMIMIFMFSSQNAGASDETSASLTYQILNLFTDLDSMSAKQQYRLVFDINVYTRAFAHFFSFFLLGFSFCRMLMEYKVRRHIVYTLVFCLLYAVSDELHQLYFSVGRAGEMIDVIKDFAGSATAVGLIHFSNLSEREEKK